MQRLQELGQHFSDQAMCVHLKTCSPMYILQISYIGMRSSYQGSISRA